MHLMSDVTFFSLLKQEKLHSALLLTIEKVFSLILRFNSHWFFFRLDRTNRLDGPHFHVSSSGGKNYDSVLTKISNFYHFQGLVDAKARARSGNKLSKIAKQTPCFCSTATSSSPHATLWQTPLPLPLLKVWLWSKSYQSIGSALTHKSAFAL